jgi:hypothetical protein
LVLLRLPRPEYSDPGYTQNILRSVACISQNHKYACKIVFLMNGSTCMLCLQETRYSHHYYITGLPLKEKPRVSFRTPFAASTATPMTPGEPRSISEPANCKRRPIMQTGLECGLMRTGFCTSFSSSLIEDSAGHRYT